MSDISDSLPRKRRSRQSSNNKSSLLLEHRTNRHSNASPNNNAIGPQHNVDLLLREEEGGDDKFRDKGSSKNSNRSSPLQTIPSWSSYLYRSSSIGRQSPPRQRRVFEIEEESPDRNINRTQSVDLLGLNDRKSEHNRNGDDISSFPSPVYTSVSNDSVNCWKNVNSSKSDDRTNIRGLNVFSVPSISSGSMRNVLYVDVDKNASHFCAMSGEGNVRNNPHNYDSIRRHMKLWLTLFIGFISLGVFIAVTAVKMNRNRGSALARSSVAKIRPVTNLDMKQTTSSGGDHHSSPIKSIQEMREAFQDWSKRHGRDYGSEEEENRRFSIWTENHYRTAEKNKRHGPSKHLGMPVFGDNHLKDLTKEEFRQKYLTGYKGPRFHQNSSASVEKGRIVGEKNSSIHPLDIERHPMVQSRYRDNWHRNAQVGEHTNTNASSSASQLQCPWWNVVCYFRWMLGTLLINAGSREPKYDASSYPSSIDWRTMGAVSSVHTQGECGACWAISSVETIESAYFIKTGEMIDLAETEVIACDDSCEQCNGGWPQNAYDYVKENKGLPAESDLTYDGSWLMDLTAYLAGESDAYSANDINSYLSDTCPNNENSQKSGDGNDANSQQRTRYAAIKGYDYATDKCYCYSDGTGCDCDNQNENRAIRNIASYGPAAICIDASLWQDYTGGIITADSGCSSQFLDMNHCVQVVGYAFISDDPDQDEGRSNSHSGSGDDQSSREGYWIVRNQWGTSWGMNGYAWVAMGENTCGILNDMTQAFMD